MEHAQNGVEQDDQQDDCRICPLAQNTRDDSGANEHEYKRFLQLSYEHRPQTARRRFSELVRTVGPQAFAGFRR